MFSIAINITILFTNWCPLIYSWVLPNDVEMQRTAGTYIRTCVDGCLTTACNAIIAVVPEATLYEHMSWGEG